MGVAYAGLSLLRAIGPESLPRLSEISLDGRALIHPDTVGVLRAAVRPLFRCCVTVLRGVVPLLGAMRTASISRERQRGRNLLVVAQVAMALVLLISAVLMIRTPMRCATSIRASPTQRRCR